MKTLRQYQIDLSKQAAQILLSKKIVYLAMEVRTGKTSTALEIAKIVGAKDVLFITKKKAISSIMSDYKDFCYTFDITVINNESLHLVVSNTYDLIISDEHHRNGAFPKMNKATQILKDNYSHLPMIFLSGTPTPESYSQIFNQFHVSKFSPFAQYANFYKWAKDYVIITNKNLGYAQVNDYSNARQDLIKPILAAYMVIFTQQQAGFTSAVSEHILECELKQETYLLIERLKKNLVIEGKNEVILADTGVKLMGKLHQMYSGTVKFESGKSMILDDAKAQFILNYFKGQKIAIFYKFKEEFEMLKNVFQNNLCSDLDIFNNTDKNIALQIISGREGISLKAAKYLVYINIDFSSVSYWQSRDRLTVMDRLANDIFYVFARDGIEKKIYKCVLDKKDYTLSQFRQDDRTTNTKQNHQKA